MKKQLILSLILMIPLTIFGQNNIQSNIDLSTVSDSTVIAIIFAEHQKLSIENPLLKEEINYYKELNNVYEEKDSIQRQEISLYKDGLNNANNQIKKLKSSQKKIIIGSSIGGIVLFILGLIL